MDHVTAWALCAGIFAAMALLAPGGSDRVVAAAASRPAAAELAGVREARGERWAPVPELAGLPETTMAEDGDPAGENEPRWSGPAGPDPAVMATRPEALRCPPRVSCSEEVEQAVC
jgi:hypothetical protein